MRIISGTFGGRKINPPAKMPYTRPTTDIAKEGLFNILQTRIDFKNIKRKYTFKIKMLFNSVRINKFFFYLFLFIFFSFFFARIYIYIYDVFNVYY